MNYHSPEIQKMMKTLTQQTLRGKLSWEIMTYTPICFMPEMDVEYNGSETENYALNIAFRCRSPKNRIIWLEIYESIGFPTTGGFPSPDSGLSLRGLSYYILRFFSSDGRILYQLGTVIQKRSQYPLLCHFADSVFLRTQSAFIRMRQNNPSDFLRRLHSHDESGGLETHPFSLLMSEFYQHNRCRDFHLLTMSCLNGLKKEREK